MRATGRTFNEDPMTISRSHSSLSLAMAWWNASGRPSPKNTMSGFMMPWVNKSVGTRTQLLKDPEKYPQS